MSYTNTLSAPPNRPAAPQTTPSTPTTPGPLDLGRVPVGDPLPPLTGTLRRNPRGFGFIDLPAPVTISGATHESIFVPPPAMSGDLYDGDTVRVLAEVQRDSRLAAQAVDLLTANRDRFVTTITTARAADGASELVAVNDPLVGQQQWPLADTACPDIDGAAGQVRPGMVAVVKVIGGHAVPVRAFTDADGVPAIRERTFTRHGIDTDYPQAALTQAEQIAAGAAPRVYPHLPRRDQRHLATFTIDADHSKDLDDAISLIAEHEDGSATIAVHIADVAGAVPAGSPLDLEAARTGTSVYVPGYVRAMFPHLLSDDALSLLPGVDREVLTCQLRIHRDGTTSDVTLYPSTVSSTRRLSYVTVAHLLNHGWAEGVDEDTREDLLLFGQLAEALQSARGARESVHVTRTEPTHRVIDENGVVGVAVEEDLAGEQIAHDLIEALMVATNEAVAGWLAAAGSDVIYRVHETFAPGDAATLGKVAASLGLEDTPVTDASDVAHVLARLAHSPSQSAMFTQSVMAALPRARYQVAPGGHFGLGSTAYAHFTSPIRRYADVLVHRLVYATLTDTPAPSVGELEAACAQINAGAAAAAKSESQMVKSMWASLLEVQRSKVREAVVTGITPRGINVSLTDSGVLVFLPKYRLGAGTWNPNQVGTAMVNQERASISLGAKVKVRVTDADVVTGAIEGRIHGPDRKPAARAATHRGQGGSHRPSPRRRRR